jgi:hypothetical protein
MGLLDVKKLRYDDQKEPLKQDKEPPSRPQSAPKKPSSCIGKNAENPINISANGNPDKKPAKNATKEKHNGASYRNDPSPALAAKSTGLEI